MQKFPVIKLIFVLALAGCAAADVPYEETAETPREAYVQGEIAPATQLELPVLTPESLAGTWVLTAQETEQALSPRAAFFESGVMLLYGADGEVSPFFWRLDGNMLNSFFLFESVYFHVELDADGALVFTYDDGLTATYALSDDDLPEKTVYLQLAGAWYFGFQTGDALLPDTIEFFPDGHGTSFYADGHERAFEWGIVYEHLLFKAYDEGEAAYIMHPLVFEPELNAMFFSRVHGNDFASFYYQPVEGIADPSIGLQGQTLYLLAMPHDMTQFQFTNRYTFEQFFLVRSVFVWHDDVVLELLTGDIDAIRERVLAAWEAQVLYFMVGYMPEIFDALPDGIGLDEGRELLYDIRLEMGLGDGHIAGIGFYELDADTNAFIVELYDAGAAWLSTFIGVAYNETMGLNFFTLERVRTPGDEAAHMFCVIGTSSRGSFFTIENTREAFVSHVRYAMDGTLGGPSGVTER